MASVNKRNGRYQVKWREGSRQRSKTFDLARDAKAFAASIDADKARGQYVSPDAGKITLEKFALDWLDAQTFDASTRAAVGSRLRGHVLPHLGHHELRAIRPSHIQAWLKRVQADLAPSTCRVALANLSAVLGAAVDDDLLRKNPCRAGSVRAPAVPKRQLVPWSDEQVGAVIDELPERWRAVAALAAGCGLRQGEVFGIHVDDLDFLGRRVLVRNQLKLVDGDLVVAPPKRGKTREVPLPDVVAVALAERLRQWPARSDGLVFVTREGGPLHRNYFVRKVWKPALERAGVTPSRENGMHALRHYFASTLMAAGVNPRAVADYLGHEDPGFTLRVYGHLLPGDEDRVRQTMQDVLAAKPAAAVPRAFPDAAGQGVPSA